MAAITAPIDTEAAAILPASFHLLRFPAGAPAREALSRQGLDRPALLATPGLRFWRLLGTGDGERMTLGVDPRRWALLAFWEREDALHDFLDRSPVSQRWDALGAERYDLRLATIRARGQWARARFDVEQAAPLPAGAPVAILTRAAIRPSRIARFWRAIPAPGAELAAHPEVLASVGIGDAPIVRQATFSLWRSLQGAQDYAYRRPAHRDVIARTREEGWYSSELFARFAIRGASGSWAGRDPLAGLL